MPMKSTSFDQQHSTNGFKVVESPIDGPTVFLGGYDQDSEIDGLELSQAADRLGVTIDEIWRRVRNGKLLARTNRGQVLVYTDPNSAVTLDGLPPLPSNKPNLWTHSSNISDSNTSPEPAAPISAALVESRDAMQRQEIALLIDHLSLAKEENREILKLTHDSMARLSEMTDKMLEMKDSVIASKEEQMHILKQRLSEQSEELRKALQEKEDLETLTQALQRP